MQRSVSGFMDFDRALGSGLIAVTERPSNIGIGEAELVAHLPHQSAACSDYSFHRRATNDITILQVIGGFIWRFTVRKGSPVRQLPSVQLIPTIANSHTGRCPIPERVRRRRNEVRIGGWRFGAVIELEETDRLPLRAARRQRRNCRLPARRCRGQEQEVVDSWKRLPSKAVCR